jgi:hypothetical protein
MTMFDQLPLFVVFLIAIVLAIGSMEVGYRVGASRRLASQKQAESPVGAILGSSIGLLAFLLAFTFNVAVERFDARRHAVLDEANAIGTTYLRAGLLKPPACDQAKDLLRQYVFVRANLAQEDSAESVVTQSEDIQQKLWKLAEGTMKDNPPPAAFLFITSLNETIDMHSKRVTLGLHSQIPTVVWVCLLAVSALSMFEVGLFCGLAGPRGWTENCVLVATFGIAMLLVADLDRPGHGFLKTDQGPILALKAQLMRQPK